MQPGVQNFVPRVWSAPSFDELWLFLLKESTPRTRLLSKPTNTIFVCRQYVNFFNLSPLRRHDLFSQVPEWYDGMKVSTDNTLQLRFLHIILISYCRVSIRTSCFVLVLQDILLLLNVLLNVRFLWCVLHLHRPLSLYGRSLLKGSLSRCLKVCWISSRIPPIWRFCGLSFDIRLATWHLVELLARNWVENAKLGSSYIAPVIVLFPIFRQKSTRPKSLFGRWSFISSSWCSLDDLPCRPADLFWWCSWRY